MTYCG